jgi:rhodanese-related sulfurtransferase
MSYETITPKQLEARIKSGEGLRLIDVREPIEYEIARIEGAELLPLSRFDEWAAALNPDEETVVMCHHGIRSAQVCAMLMRGGFKRLYNLAGGIDRWSQDVDSSVPLY